MTLKELNDLGYKCKLLFSGDWYYFDCERIPCGGIKLVQYSYIVIFLHIDRKSIFTSNEDLYFDVKKKRFSRGIIFNPPIGKFNSLFGNDDP